MMMRDHVRPTLLFLSQTLPFPPDGGVKIRTYNILRLLARSFDITALCFYRWKTGMTQRDVAAHVEALREFGHVEAFPIPQEHNRLRLVWDHLRSVARARTYTVYSYESRAFRQALTSVLAQRSFDLVHADSMDLSGYFPMLGSLPIVCTHHDATSVQLRRRANKETHAPRKWYVNHQSELMEREEREWCERVALNATVSAHDMATLQRIAPRGRFAIVPNGVDTDYFTPQQGVEVGLVCVGALSWFPNRDALQYFADAILPYLPGDSGMVNHLRWVGQAAPDEREHFLARYRIEVTGHVPDIRPYVRDAACYVVPIRVGGGTRVKILDAWAMGKAVVSTSIGCEGLDAVDGENILVRDDPREFAEAVQAVLSDRALRERLGRAGRRTVETSYSWEVIGHSMIQEYRALVGPTSRSSAVGQPGQTAVSGSGTLGSHLSSDRSAFS